MGFALVPILLELPFGTAKVSAPVPLLKTLFDPLSVMEPPVLFPPVLVARLIVPPLPVVIFVALVNCTPPVPPAAAFTVNVTADVVVFVVVKLPPDAITKLFAPLPAVFAFNVIVPEPPFTVLEIVRPVLADNKIFPVVVVKFAAVASDPPLLINVKLPEPVEIALAGNVNVPEEVTLNALLVFNVGAANVMLPVLLINAPPLPAVKVNVPVDVV